MTHKYMSQEIGDAERAATFVVREGILQSILERLRADAGTGAPNSFHIAGPRGSGKTTLLHMVRQRVTADAFLGKHYWPVILPEEQVAASSLRDFLSAILEQMKEDGSAVAATWYARCEAEPDDETSAGIAEVGLAELARAEGKILLIGVENFDCVLAQTLRKDHERAVLRRLMIDKPLICLLATSTTLLEATDSYDNPLFGHFVPIDLPTLGDKEAEQLLQAYAAYRSDKALQERLRGSRGIVRSLNLLTGGNPRLLLMLYDVISLQKIDVAVDALQALVDEMTPLYNGLLDRLSTGQRKVLDAIMRAGGAAQPTTIAKAVRGMKLAEVTSHLRRLKQDGYVTANKGGKGRPAYYAASDRFFGTWYRLRYLRAGKRPIELFVEFLQAWYTTDERLAAFHHHLSVAETERPAAPTVRPSDYLLYSMSRTDRFDDALSAMIAHGNERKLAGDTAAAIAQYTSIIDMPDAPVDQRAIALGNRGVTYDLLGNSAAAIRDLSGVINMTDATAEKRAWALINRGFVYERSEDVDAAFADYTCVIEMTDAPAEQRATALVQRGHRKLYLGRDGDIASAIADFTQVIDMTDASIVPRTLALVNRGSAHSRIGDTVAAIADCTRVIDMADVPAAQRASAFVNRGITFGETGDSKAEIADYSQVIGMPDAPNEKRSAALVYRGITYKQVGDNDAAIADFTRAIEMADSPAALRAHALVNRGLAQTQAGDRAAAIADWTRVVDMADSPAEQRASAFVNRGIIYSQAGDNAAAVADWTLVIEMADAPEEWADRAQACLAFSMLADADRASEIAAYTCVIETTDTTAEHLALALVKRGIAYGRAGDIAAAIADLKARALIGTSVHIVHDATSFLRDLAQPILRSDWPAILEAVLSTLPEEHRDMLLPLKLVADRLRGAPEADIDRQAPEVRDFVLEVLARFEEGPSKSDPD